MVQTYEDNENMLHEPSKLLPKYPKPKKVLKGLIATLISLYVSTLLTSQKKKTYL